MNEEPPEELAVVVRKNADADVRLRLQKLCDTIVADSTGLPVQSDLDAKLSALITQQMIPLRDLARSAVRTIDPADDLICLRFSSHTKEYFLMWDEQFLLSAIQKVDSTGIKDITSRIGFNSTSPRLYD